MKVRAAVTLTLAAVMATSIAWSADEPLTTVIVTGSRIARPEFDNLQPTSVVTGEFIDARGQTNVIDALNEIPAFGPPTASAVGAQGSSFGVGQSFADFFSLGSQRTLTLVNGRRFVSSNTPSVFGPDNSGQQVDLNVIPTKLVERIDVVAVGGAPVYGADAIAGTVNIILRKKYEGLDVDTQYGQTGLGDAENYRVRALAGTNFADGRGNLVANVEFNKTKGLVVNDRQRTRDQFSYVAPADASPFDQVLVKNLRFNVLSFGGVPLLVDFIPNGGGVTNAMGVPLAFAPNGNLVPFDLGDVSGEVITSVGGDGLNLGDVTNLLTPQERTLVTGLGSFQISDKVRAFGEAWYSNTKATRTTSQPIFNSLLFGNAGDPSGNLVFDINNPFLTPQARSIIQQQLIDNDLDPTTFFLARANTDIATGRAEGETDIARFVLGLDGDVELFGNQYKWEVSGNYGRSESDSTQPDIVQQNFLNALNAVRDPSGNIVCAPGAVSSPVRTRSSTCAPLNLFGFGAPSQAARDYITTSADTTSTISQRVFNANISGPLFELPAGKVEAVLGYENRRETFKFKPDDFFGQGLGRSVQIGGISGDFETDEVFTELLVPIFSPGQDIPGLHSLQFEGALRYVDHSIAGGDPTYTTGLRYAPVRDVQFRANSTTAIRSPSVQEAFNPTVPAFSTANDPCDRRFINAGPNPAQRAANCSAAGIPANFTSQIVNATGMVSVSGNLNLENEEADSDSIGVVVRPRWVPNLTVAVDWIRIELDNAIVGLSATQVLEACFDSANFPAEPLCGAIDRNPNGQVAFVRTSTQNAGLLKFKGVTSEINYALDLNRFGALNFGVKYFNLHELTTRVGSGDVDHAAGEIGTSKHQGTVSVTYTKNDFSWLVQGNFIGKAKADVDELPTARDVKGVDNWYLFNSTFSYKVDKHLSTRLIVDNVFDRDPPFPVPALGGTITYFRGLLGRNFSLALNYSF